jgi:hypothetical protein
MGLAASQGRLLMLTARKSDLEFQVQIINQRRTILAQQSSRLISQYVNAMYQTNNVGILNATDINDPTTIQNIGALPGFTFSASVPQTELPTGIYEQQMAGIQSLDKELELREKDLETQHKEVETEYDSVKKVIDKNIETSFKTFG